ncbi:hypothetical protein [Streptacidiphilus cavernicola]|uniref:Uncharacterized protein n=1 Tax=Streptacidiphilus cavernicola TaxID=3342716 RepID=A0ABV6VP12_9ACTN
MSVYDATPEEEISQAAERMAVRALAVFHTVEGADAPRPDALEDSKPALAAARVLGADLFAPYLLTRRPLHAELEEAVALAQAFQLFPAAASGVAAAGAAAVPAAGVEGAGAVESAGSVVAWRDWAAGHLLSRCAPAASAGPLAAVSAPGPAPMPERCPVLGDELRWREWAGWMAQVSPLALPGIDSPVHEAALRNTRALARGAVRAMLRRDYRTAARIARWLALGRSLGADSPLDLAPMLRHLRMFGGPSARTALDLCVGERLVEAAGEL